MRPINETIILIAEQSAKAKFSNHMSGSMIPRGLDFWSIAKTLEVIYGDEGSYDNTLEEFVDLEDHYFDKEREKHVKAYEKEHGKA